MLSDTFIHEAIRNSLYKELDLSPKPGLVSKQDNGCHKDMDYMLMATSIETISPLFYSFIDIGYNNDLNQCLTIARPIARKIEDKMFLATDGVNTHKGAIYLFAITNLAIGYAVRHKQSWSSFITNFKALNQQDYDALINTKVPRSYGQKIYSQYQLTGIIGEVNNDLQTVFTYGLPILQRTNNDFALLLSLIIHSQDTCILHHNDLDTYYEVKEKARELYTLFITDNEDFNKEYKSFCKYCNLHHISFGGSADLFSLTYYLETIRKEIFTFHHDY